MNLIKWIKNEINYFGVPKKQRMDYYIQCLISEKTGFKPERIELLIAKKTRMKQLNEFNYFEFIYRKKKYILEDGKLKEDSN